VFFPEAFAALIAVAAGSVEEKLDFVFDLFDRNQVSGEPSTVANGCRSPLPQTCFVPETSSSSVAAALIVAAVQQQHQQ
jgi:hypothetical protein